MAYVYRHIRKDKNQVFYVGIGGDEEGKYERAYSKHSRNNHWYHITQKTDYEVHIMFDDFTWDESCEKEREFIKLYGRRDLGIGTLVNMTDGGDGTLGMEGKKGVLNPMYGKTGSLHHGHLLTGSLASCWGRTGSLHPMYGRTGSLNPMYGTTGSLAPSFGKTGSLAYNSKPVMHIESEIEFSSFTEAGLYFGITKQAISQQLKKGKFKLI